MSRPPANGEALLGAFTLACKLDRKRGIRIEVSNSVQDSFIKNRSVVRCEMRAFLAVTRSKAFVKVTGLPTGA